MIPHPRILEPEGAAASREVPANEIREIPADHVAAQRDLRAGVLKAAPVLVGLIVEVPDIAKLLKTGDLQLEPPVSRGEEKLLAPPGRHPILHERASGVGVGQHVAHKIANLLGPPFGQPVVTDLLAKLVDLLLLMFEIALPAAARLFKLTDSSQKLVNRRRRRGANRVIRPGRFSRQQQADSD